MFRADPPGPTRGCQAYFLPTGQIPADLPLGVDRRPGQTLAPPALPGQARPPGVGADTGPGPTCQRVLPADPVLSAVLSPSKEFLCDQKYSDEENLPEKLAAFKGKLGLSAPPPRRAGLAPWHIGFLTPQGQPTPPVPSRTPSSWRAVRWGAQPQAQALAPLPASMPPQAPHPCPQHPPPPSCPAGRAQAGSCPLLPRPYSLLGPQHTISPL